MEKELIDNLIGLGLTEDQIKKLEETGVKESSDMELLSSEEVISVTGCNLVVGKKITAAFTPKVNSTPATMAFAADNILPEIPTDDSWLEALRTGGILKVDESTVIAAIRAALASKVGLYNVPEKLAQKMEEFADENADVVPAEFFSIRKQLTRRSYSEIFSAIDGLDGNFVTEKRKKSFLSKVDEHLWPEVISFYNQLKNWMDTWQKSSSNPMAFMSVVASMVAGGGNASSGAMIPPPETGALRDAAEALNDRINKVFAGVGVQVASALAYDAVTIKKMLENSKLPALVGAANREQMLRSLGANVPATYPRLETSLTRFVMSVIKIKDVPAGDEENQYFWALANTGSTIQWDKIVDGGLEESHL